MFSCRRTRQGNNARQPGESRIEATGDTTTGRPTGPRRRSSATVRLAVAPITERKQAARRITDVLLVVDQFEELFTLCPWHGSGCSGRRR
ncbi:nSTAND1 domain-containing NTPase [Kibdelosporangium banguiense]|uniref:nSTAND1 domain-containing NTPase n=1 Tax=Kibdelosporangium banguiense TaxID=1365924 RepID=UPI003556DF3D